MGLRANAGSAGSQPVSPSEVSVAHLQQTGSPRTPSRVRNPSPNQASAFDEHLDRPASAMLLSGRQLQASSTTSGGPTTPSRRKPEGSASGKHRTSGGPKLRARQAQGSSAAPAATSNEAAGTGGHLLRHANSEQLGSHAQSTTNNFETGSPVSTQHTNNGSSTNKSSAKQAARQQQQQQQLDLGVGRPQSALAGSASAAVGAGSLQQTSMGAWGGAQCAQPKARRDSAGAIPGANHQAANSLRPTKTTRVRINSTSEQIQDPNWLIRMSRELEQPQPKKSHLRSLQRKLKSTISSATSSSGNQSSSSQSNQNSQGASAGSRQPGGQEHSGQHLEDPLLSLPPSKPTTPIKVPVSILKQSRSSNNPNRPLPPTSISSATTRQPPAVPHNQQQQQPPAAARQSRARPSQKQQQQVALQSASSHPNHSTSTHSSGGHQHNLSLSQQQQQQTLLSLTGASKESTQIQPADQISARTSNQKLTTSSSNSAPPATASRPEPICAEGQVKVSGWKRNNLLAKTLSHLDEIRGNQRPVFVPTKIRLPSTEIAIGSGAGNSTGLQASGGGGSVQVNLFSGGGLSRSPSPGSSSKFADIVREAMASKRGDQMGQQQATKRTLDGERKESRDLGGGGSEIIRAVSADPTNGCQISSSNLGQSTSGSGQYSTGTGSGLHQQQQRSSSAGLSSSMGNSNKQQQQQQQQQVIVSLNWGGGGNQTGTNSSSQAASQRGPITAVATPHLMNQLLSVSAQQSSQLLESGSSSTRQFKLQHKNHQVLQNLRRQSNELQASLNAAALKAAAREASGGGGGGGGGSPSASPGGSGGRTKDWKRLAGKLAMLTGGGKHSPSSSTKPRSPLGSLGADLGLINSNQLPLRLTVSNQETGDFRLQKRGSGQFSQGLMVPGQGRKLSSSSMVVEPHSHRSCGSAASNQQPQHRRSNSPRLSSTALDMELMVAQVVSPRRSSDSEAYRAPAAATSKAIPSLGAGLSPSSELLPVTAAAAETRQLNQINKTRPVVLHRDDLLHLLQVTSSSGQQQASGSSFQAAHPSRRSLQLTVDQLPRMNTSSNADRLRLSGDEESGKSSEFKTKGPLSDEEKKGASGSDNSESSVTIKSWSAERGAVVEGDESRSNQQQQQQQRLHRLGSVKSMDELMVDSSLVSCAEKDADDNLTKSNHENGNGGPEVATTNSSSSKRRTDLSWVVKKTSKVVFFHEKLRKMRWHMKQSSKSAANQQPSSVNSASDESGSAKFLERKPEAAQENAPPPTTTNVAALSDNQKGGHKNSSTSNNKGNSLKEASLASHGDVFMDPTLIGDAIEIFLRNTMQQSSVGQLRVGKDQENDDDDDDDDDDDGGSLKEMKQPVGGGGGGGEQQDARVSDKESSLLLEASAVAGGKDRQLFLD